METMQVEIDGEVEQSLNDGDTKYLLSLLECENDEDTHMRDDSPTPTVEDESLFTPPPERLTSTTAPEPLPPSPPIEQT